MTAGPDYENWLEYEKFLNTLPRAERRRILRAHLKRADQANRAAIRETLRNAKHKPTTDDELYMKGN